MDFSVDCTNVKMAGQSITTYSVTFTLIHFIKAGRKNTYEQELARKNETKERKKAAQQLQDAFFLFTTRPLDRGILGASRGVAVISGYRSTGE